MVEQPLRNSYERPLVLPEDLPLALDRQDARPLAVQLTDELRAAAGCGAVRIGDRLPSTRALATTLGVSRTVTAAAYDALQAEGWIGGRRGAGTYVIAAPGVPAPPHTGPSPVPEQQPERGIDLRPGSPWSAGLRRAAWRRAWRAAADAEVLTRLAGAGLPEFRTAGVNHLFRPGGLRRAGGHRAARPRQGGVLHSGASVPAGRHPFREPPAGVGGLGPRAQGVGAGG